VSAIGIIRNEDQVVLVESRYPGTKNTFWGLPGGMWIRVRVCPLRSPARWPKKPG
jgi:hypothetical protein